MKKTFTDLLTSGLGKTAFFVKKNSPTILVITGIVTGIGCVVTACRASMKLSPIVEETKKGLEDIRKCADNPEFKEVYSEQDKKRDTTIVYAGAIKEIAKLYSIPAGLGILSVVSILASHHMLHKRNAAITAAYIALDDGYKKYRARVINRFGDEVERRIRYGLKAQEIEEEIIDENGNKMTVKKTVEVPDDSDPAVVITDDGVFTVDGTIEPSPYARYLDMSSEYWDKNNEYNLKLLRDTEDHFNKILRYKRHVFLNEVYDKLGIPRSREGQAVGWIYDPDMDGMKQIDFGIYDIHKPDNRDFVNGWTREILLDFKVRPILDDAFPITNKRNGEHSRPIPVTC